MMKQQGYTANRNGSDIKACTHHDHPNHFVNKNSRSTMKSFIPSTRSILNCTTCNIRINLVYIRKQQDLIESKHESLSNQLKQYELKVADIANESDEAETRWKRDKKLIRSLVRATLTSKYHKKLSIVN
ncbi:hypothetical protein ACED31_15155 [Vibrio splendidus]|uniref:Uncharacterized protein n=1 Tax=Vibrio splendidus TaxID=29497 RepID=A0ABV4LRL1_VIBSP|nr:hypothetical protein [Vibrio splendidus]MDH5976309.1 hypothetical protein [Vibrio splendidus]